MSFTPFLTKHRATKGRAAVVAASASVVLLVAGCGSSSSSSASAGSSSSGGSDSTPLSGKTIAYIQTGSIPYYEFTAKGVQAAVTKLGGSTKVSNSNFDASTELANVQNAITAQVDGVVLEPLSDATVKAELRLLNAAKIPTVVLYGYNSDLRDQAVSFQQASNQSTGEAAGNEMKKLVPSGDVAIITGTPGRSDVAAYTAGFLSGFGRSAVSTLNGNWDRQTAYNVTKDLITAHPDLKGIFVQNEDMAIGSISALGSKAKDIAIVTQNGSPDGVPYLKNDQIKASIGWSPTQEGVMSVQSLADNFEGNPRPTKLCLTPYAVNTPQDPEASVRWEPTPEVIDTSLKTECADGSQ